MNIPEASARSDWEIHFPDNTILARTVMESRGGGFRGFRIFGASVAAWVAVTISARNNQICLSPWV
jgi:hypothetical protein